MKEFIRNIVDKICSNSKLAELENKMLDKYEKYTSIPAPEEIIAEVKPEKEGSKETV